MLKLPAVEDNLRHAWWKMFILEDNLSINLCEHFDQFCRPTWYFPTHRLNRNIRCVRPDARRIDKKYLSPVLRSTYFLSQVLYWKYYNCYVILKCEVSIFVSIISLFGISVIFDRCPRQWIAIKRGSEPTTYHGSYRPEWNKTYTHKRPFFNLKELTAVDSNWK